MGLIHRRVTCKLLCIANLVKDHILGCNNLCTLFPTSMYCTCVECVDATVSESSCDFCACQSTLSENEPPIYQESNKKGPCKVNAKSNFLRRPLHQVCVYCALLVD